MPFGVQPEGVGLGSGFVVDTKPEPIIITNAHVVSNSPKVSVQLLVYGSEQFPAKVVSICKHFDLAILKLQDPADFVSKLSEKKMKLEKLSL